MNILDKALAIAVKGHANHLDKSGEHRIIHAIDVMMACREDFLRRPVPGFTLSEWMAAGVIHDVPEDCPDYPLEYIAEHLGSKVHCVVKRVTRLCDVAGKVLETYSHFIGRSCETYASARMKLTDVRRNRLRIHTLPPEEQTIDRRYERAEQRLRFAILKFEYSEEQPFGSTSQIISDESPVVLQEQGTIE